MARRAHPMASEPDDGIESASESPSRIRGARRWLLVALASSAVATIVVGLLVGARAIDWNDLPAFLDRLGAWRDSPLAMIATVVAFALGALIVFPVNLLIAASIIVFGPIAGGGVVTSELQRIITPAVDGCQSFRSIQVVGQVAP